MINAMTISLSLLNNRFEAIAHIKCPCNQKKKLSFCINNDFHISKIEGNVPLTFCKTDETPLPFRSLSQRIEITGQKPIKEVHIHYTGNVQIDEKNKKNFNNIITPDVVSMNWYSVWYPQELSVRLLKNSVVMQNGRPWFVLKADYDAEKDTWTYGKGRFDPYNIAAYKKDLLRTVSQDNIKIYTVDQPSALLAEKAMAIYKEIVQYYNGNLFRKKKIPLVDVPCFFPAITTPETAYQRRGLMWCANMGNNVTEIARLFAHETAHLWCNGAKTNSWEDWLNETTAEWAALLFAIKTNDQALFDIILQPKLRNDSALPNIQSPDGTRPAGVHEKGTVLFYKAYLASDFETMEKAVRIFTELTIKNTNHYLKNLRQKGLTEIADLIEQGLTENVPETGKPF